MTIVYKVCRRVGDEFVSAIVDSQPEAVITYAPDVKIEPRIEGSLLFAFDNAELAYAFKRHEESYSRCLTVFECETDDVQDFAYARRARFTLMPRYWVAILNGWKPFYDPIDDRPPEFCEYSTFPPGTVGCKWLILRKELPVKEADYLRSQA